MCKFFSFVSDPGKPIPDRFMYFDWPTRKKILAKKLNYEADSHTSIADFYGYKGEAEDLLNKYEYNPLLETFTVDQINHKIDDQTQAKKWVRELNFKKIVAPLIIKPIINPFDMVPSKITPELLDLLKQWASVWDSVWNSVGNSVGNSVWNSVGNSVGNSVWNSVGNSVGNSVWNSVWAYHSSFFEIKYKYDFSPAIKLWEMGLVPSYDGKVWRLHGGKGAAILWEGVLK
jgi:hypothetical protein